jgi:hypothetical protein
LRAAKGNARACSKDERDRLLALGCDLATVCYAATTTPRDRKELLRALLEEVIIKVECDKAVTLEGRPLGEIDALPRPRPVTIRTAADTRPLSKAASPSSRGRPCLRRCPRAGARIADSFSNSAKKPHVEETLACRRDGVDRLFDLLQRSAIRRNVRTMS